MQLVDELETKLPAHLMAITGDYNQQGFGVALALLKDLNGAGHWGWGNVVFALGLLGFSEGRLFATSSFHKFKCQNACEGGRLLLAPDKSILRSCSTQR